MSVYSKIHKKKILIETLSQLLVDGSTEIEKQDNIAFSKIADEQVYNADIFRQRFQMRRHVFLRIVDTLSNSTIIECLKKFVEGVISVFKDVYLRKPNPNDVRRLLQMAEGRGFPGILGSIDCMHW
ncbi:uncharacterized protein LOC130966824 [Arachis stenosperma]|uniref:uncharacterized protein LOC130966824 n=1 Tax=Arachis stenosperma TaxID=217475 RepID=UPI0025AC3D54|nr:uncharacterized protein LOC130966824 [Arachis stenosperma]